MKFATKAIHAGIKPDSTTGAIMTPIYQSSTFVQEDIGVHKGFAYSRTSNPTRQTLEQSIASLENGEFGACFASGMAAIDCVLKMLKPGDEVITTNDLYGGAYRIFKTVFEQYGIKFHFVDMLETDHIAQAINDKTKLIWIETPSNPIMNIIDIQAIALLTQSTNIILGIDNTFATPFLQNPLDLGADIVMHSVTKYIGGHSDIIMGALVCNDVQIANEMYRIQNSCGAISNPMDCFFALRGIKTLHLRMQRHCENAKIIAEFLKQHSKIDQLYWPGLSTHKNHNVAKRQMKDFGGMISFSLIDNNLSNAKKIVRSTQYFKLAESLGGVESLIGHPATMTHASIPKIDREKLGIVDSLIRLSVGIEDAQDLVTDIENALNY